MRYSATARSVSYTLPECEDEVVETSAAAAAAAAGAAAEADVRGLLASHAIAAPARAPPAKITARSLSTDDILGP